jgi:hypothetical protein
MTDFANGSTPRILLKLYLTGTGTAATGKTVAVTISKNGAAFGNPSAGATNATEIANGWYYVDLSATDTGTNGPLIVRGTNADCDPSETHDYVVPAGFIEGGIQNLDDYELGSFVYLTFNSKDTSGAPRTLSTDGSIIIYKNEDTTQRTSSNGITLYEDFDSITGTHKIVIDTGDNTDPGFWALYSEYSIHISGAVVAGTTINRPLATFSIQNRITAGLASDLADISTGLDALAAEIGTAGAGLTNINLPDQTMNITGNITGNLSGSVGSVTGLTVSNLDAAISSRASAASVAALNNLSAAQVNAEVDTALADYAAGTLEAGITRDGAAKITLASAAGKYSGAATATGTFRNTADTVDRIVSTHDADGNRTGVVLNTT